MWPLEFLKSYVLLACSLIYSVTGDTKTNDTIPTLKELTLLGRDRHKHKSLQPSKISTKHKCIE